ncbi:MAG: ABC transporter ATP-binding protein [Methylobacteriaceae bacterium]|nr:ABC transporter ATP-binding protein [Methylobacteriaceae bacterium]
MTHSAGSPAPPILVVEDVHKSFGGVRAVAGASFALQRGAITALIGPNGAGKTTLFDLITGFAAPDAGAIRFEGKPIEGLPPHSVTRRGLVRTFQLTRVFAAMTVLDNMMLAGRGQPGEGLLQLIARRTAGQRVEGEVRERALAALHRFDLDGKAGDYAGTLSGGQRKLLELARALMTDPTLVLLDEPMAGVNRVLGSRLLDDVEELRRTAGMTFLFVEHDMDIVMRRADHVIVMAEGAVIAEGSPDAIRADPRVIDAYLGQARSRT